MNRPLPKTEWWHLTDDDFVHLDIPTEIERHTSTRLHPTGKQWIGACPFDDCSVDHDGFIVWDELARSKNKRHYYCRGCNRSGNIVKLLQEINEIDFYEACKLLQIGDPEAMSKPRPKRPKSNMEIWDEKQVAWLNEHYGAFTYYATSHPNAVAYFAQRCIPLDVVAELGIGYIPAIDKSAAQTNPEGWKMRYWSDRIIFPLPGHGFRGRTLFKWEPGMSESDHKAAIDDYNERVKAYNERAEQKYGRDGAKQYRKSIIPRYKSTTPGGYFRADVLKDAEHVTFVEGEFDVCTLYTIGIKDAIATGTDMVDINAIPLKICDVTLAHDGDLSGVNAALNWSKQLRRKGIAVTCTIPPDDGNGKDWNERLQLVGHTGMQVDPISLDDLIAIQVYLTELKEYPSQWCATCLGEKDTPDSVVTPALPDNYEGIMYCRQHHPLYQNLEPEMPILSQNYEKPAVKGPKYQREKVV